MLGGEQFCKVATALSPKGSWPRAEEVCDWAMLLLLWCPFPLIARRPLPRCHLLSAPPALRTPGPSPGGSEPTPCAVVPQGSTCTLGKAAGGAEGASGCGGGADGPLHRWDGGTHTLGRSWSRLFGLSVKSPWARLQAPHCQKPKYPKPKAHTLSRSVLEGRTSSLTSLRQAGLSFETLFSIAPFFPLLPT